jgi:glycerol-3-phosphate acyltransferase PlsY
LGYLIGAIPTGAWIARIGGIADITQHGSGNIGATNVGRLLGPFYFCVVFFIDLFKAFIYLKISPHKTPYEELIIAGALLFGNGYSLFLRGKGGKGVATAAGIGLALFPDIFFALGFIWAIAFFITKTVGIASAITFFMLPLIGFFTPYQWPFFCLMLSISIWGLYRHKDNLRRYIFIKQ